MGNATDSVISGLAEEFSETTTQLMETLTGFWLDLPIPVLTGPNSTAVWLQDRTAIFVGAAAVLGILVAAARMALTLDKRPGMEAFKGLMWLILVTSGGAFVVTQLVYIADAWATWIYQESVGDESINVGLGLTSAVSPGLVLIMALAAAITGVVQIGLMLARAALIPVILGLLPVAAAAGVTGTGRQWFTKLVAWLAAFILYKPVAAFLYAAAFQLADGRDGILGMVSGVVLLMLAVLALPALMRLIVPATAAVGSANPAAIGAGIAGAAATGAITIVAAGAALASRGSSVAATGAAKTSRKAASGAGSAGKGASTGGSPAGPSGAGPRPSGGGSPAPSGSGGGGPSTSGGSGPMGSTGSGGAPGADGTTGSSPASPSGGAATPSTSGDRAPAASSPRGGGAPGGAPRGAGARSSSGRPPMPRVAPQRIPEATGSMVTDDEEKQS